MSDKEPKCINCHFFVRLRKKEDKEEEERLEIAKKIRDDFINIIGGHVKKEKKLEGYWGKIGCHFLYWNDTLHHQYWNKIVNKIQEDRKNECFFWPFKEGMGIEAAEVLQKRDEENRRLGKGWRYTRWAICIAGVGLIFNAFPELKDIFKKPFSLIFLIGLATLIAIDIILRIIKLSE